MTLLELISKASANPQQASSKPSKHPFILNSDIVYSYLEPQSKDLWDSSLVTPVIGWKISRTDEELIKSARIFYKKLKLKLKNVRNLNPQEFLELLTSFLEKRGNEVGVKLGIAPSDLNYRWVLLEKLGFLMGRDVSRLVTEASVVLEVWELLGCLIVNGLVPHSSYSSLVTDLVNKRRSDLLSLCVKHFKDVQSSDVLCILKYFLSLPQDGYGTLLNVKREWQRQGLLAIEMISDGTLVGDNLRLGKEASILLMIAHDEFSDSELCLHYLLSSLEIDEVILGSAISNLSGSEMMGLIRYLGKWVRKYERFPQACLCPDASSMLGLNVLEWVPTLDDVVKCLGLVVDEHFSSLILHPEFHEELRSIEEAVNSLTMEAKFCFSLANVVENVRAKAKAAKS